MKTFSLTLLFVFISFFTFAQVDDDDAQLFGLRSVSATDENSATNYNFGLIKTSTATHSFNIENSSSYDMEIVGVDAPQGIGVTLKSKIIKSKTIGGFIVTVNRDLLPKGDFNKKIVIKVKQRTPLGEITEDKIFYVSGSL